jgi:gluconokinase
VRRSRAQPPVERRDMPAQGDVILVMGVSGSGKTTIGRLLAAELGCRFIEADDYHSLANKQKMERGEALDDHDRATWLAELRRLVVLTLDRGECAVLACSALKQRYRELLRVDPARMPVVYLRGSPQLISERLAARTGHFAARSLLTSQLETLEEPNDAIIVDVTDTPEQIVERLRRLLQRPP